MPMLGEMNMDKLNNARVESAVTKMVDAMMSTPGITIPEMVTAALRLAGGTCRQALQQSSQGALLRNQELLRNALHGVLFEAVSDRSTVQ